MLKNYLITVYRNFLRQPFQSSLNVFCLALSVAATLLILLYIRFELTYDQFHPQAGQIYRIETQAIQTRDQLREVDWSSTPANLATYIRKDYPEVEATVRLYQFWQNERVALDHDGAVYQETEIYAADPSVLEVFSFPLIYGDARTALDGPEKIVLSESLARQIFGEMNPVGKLLKSKLAHLLPDTPEEHTLMVTGVYPDLPKNTNLSAKALLSSATDAHLDQYYFDRFMVATYVRLPLSVEPDSLASRLSQIYLHYLDSERDPVMVSAHHTLTPLTNIHLKETGGYTYVYIYGAVSLLLLVLAMISYVNLLTAQADTRSREIGVRKVMGSRRGQLIVQFLTESTLFAGLALMTGVAMLIVSLPYLNTLLGLQLSLELLGQPPVLLGMLGILLVLGMLGGSYPAFFLSAFPPLSVIKTRPTRVKSLRGVLLSLQFVVVLFVLSCTLMVYDQLEFMRKKDLGFDQEHIMMLALPGPEASHQGAVLKDMLLQDPRVVSVGGADFVPGVYGMIHGPVAADGAPDVGPQFVHRGRIDSDFLATMKIRLVAGRNFSVDRPADSTQAVIINQALARLFGLDQPVGERIRLGGKGNPNYLEVIGVVEDFQQGSLHSVLEPQLFRWGDTNRLAVKIAGDPTAGLEHIETSWARVFPDATFDYSFLDESLQNLYTADRIRGRVFLLLSLLTLGVAFAGLYGLAAFLSRQRTKEIGIRKVLGAGLGNIIVLMTYRFLLLVVIAALPAFLLAGYVMRAWLESFAHRIGVNYGMLGGLLLATLLLTLLTTGWHARRTALANPIDSLCNE